MIVGGIAITTLYEMPAARSNKLVRRNWAMNGCQISYSENPLKPGMNVFLLCRITVFTPGAVTICRLRLKGIRYGVAALRAVIRLSSAF